jgi:hypothetical protein
VKAQACRLVLAELEHRAPDWAVSAVNAALHEADVSAWQEWLIVAVCPHGCEHDIWCRSRSTMDRVCTQLARLGWAYWALDVFGPLEESLSDGFDAFCLVPEWWERLNPAPREATLGLS